MPGARTTASTVLDVNESVAGVLSAGLLVDDEPLLAVARDEIIRHGLRRATVADIARRADVSRVTVYRRLGDKDAIIRAVMTREIVGFLTRALQDAPPLPPMERMVELFVQAVLEFRRNDLASALLEYEPELLLMLFDEERRTEMIAIRDAAASALLGDVPIEAARQIAELGLRLTATLLVAPSDVLPLEDEADARQFATTYLSALLEAAKGTNA